MRPVGGPPLVNRMKTHCLAGHELVGDNLDTYMLKHGRRSCVLCARRRWMAYYERNKPALQAKVRAWKAANL